MIDETEGAAAHPDVSSNGYKAKSTEEGRPVNSG
jgi:hypothetical protein